jgi:EAL domain-containing protein (putative c-di-GMP-specific phosphodiesterase class I)
VNVSAKQFSQVDFVDQVNTAINKYAIDASKLKLELTESMLVDNIEQINILQRLRNFDIK